MNVTKTFKTSIGVKTVTTNNETNNDSDNNTPVCLTQLMDQPEYTQTEDEETINSGKLQSDTDNESINGDDTNHHPIFKQDTNHTSNHTDENVAMTRQDKNTLSSLHIVPASLRKKFVSPMLPKNKPTANTDAKMAATPTTDTNQTTSDTFTTPNAIRRQLITPPYPNPNHLIQVKNIKNMNNSPHILNFKQKNQDRQPIMLSEELEPLRNLIMSQQAAFTTQIIDLGNTSLTYSKAIDKKKESFQQLKDEANTKIPRSLRLKCELTTSPVYASHPRFLSFREQFKEKLDSFIKEGTSIMTDWAKTNLELLIQDRCTQIMSKAMRILDGLTGYHMEVIGTPCWPSTPPNQIPLLLLKIYLSNLYIDITHVTDYFELPKEDILNIGAKAFLNTHTNRNRDIQETLQKIDLADVDPEEELQYSFITETLEQFNKILKTVTIDILSVYRTKQKVTTAERNLQTKMKIADIMDVTEATANSIARATENIDSMNQEQAFTDLRLNNLEKISKRHEHKQNELNNKMKRALKNCKGTRNTEPSNHPRTSALKTNLHKLVTVDLTEDEQEDMSASHWEQSRANTQNKNKKPRTNPYQNNKRSNKPPHSVQWKSNVTKQYNPSQPGITSPIQPQQETQYRFNNTPLYHPPAFTPAPSPFTVGLLQHQMPQFATAGQHQPYTQNHSQPNHWQFAMQTASQPTTWPPVAQNTTAMKPNPFNNPFLLQRPN